MMMKRSELLTALGQGKFNPKDWIKSPDDGTLTHRENLLIHLKLSNSGALYYFHYGRTHMASFCADFVDSSKVDVHRSEKEELTELEDAMKPHNDFNEYQDYVNRVASGYELSDFEKQGIHTEHGLKAISQELAYNIVGMSGEAGESLEKLKKAWRDVGVDNVYESLSEPKKRHGLALEIGDVLYYAARVANLLGYKLSEIAEMHIEKLNGRIERGTVKGEGDYR